ncbi:MAG TPA: OmpA family protein [Bryobacteraceae bacterium]|nr:OmpA family protein [Bryobacteraceae bacterium]
MKIRQAGTMVLAFSALLLAGACKKKVPPPPPPPAPAPAPAPAPPRPTISFTAEPSTIERGQSAVLHWNVTQANQISIDQGIGSVQANGERRVYPNDTTTYRLTATGPGGTETATATVTVTAPPPPPPPKPSGPSFADRVGQLKDAYFDFDKSDIRSDAKDALTSDADALKSIFNDFPSGVVVVEGHCDERGSAEYNLGLGDRRSTATKDFLVQLGVPADRLKTISYGKERPVCTEHNEECWQKNRHVHFSPGQ